MWCGLPTLSPGITGPEDDFGRVLESEQQFHKDGARLARYGMIRDKCPLVSVYATLQVHIRFLAEILGSTDSIYILYT